MNYKYLKFTCKGTNEIDIHNILTKANEEATTNSQCGLEFIVSALLFYDVSIPT